MNRLERHLLLIIEIAAAMLLAHPARAQELQGSTAHPPRELHAPVRVCAGGDVTLGTNLDTAWHRIAKRTLRARYHLRDDPAILAAPLRPLLKDADVVLLNVEGAVGDGPAPQKCGPKSRACFALRQPVSAAAALRAVAESAVVVGNLANNHAHDAGDAGLDTSINYLAQAGLLVTGADTLATPVSTRAGDTLGVLGFHTDSRTPDARDLDAVQRHVARAVERYGTVIVTMHLGAEGVDAQRTADGEERYLDIDRGNPVAFANAAFAAGATLVVGHGPHVLRAAEWHGDRLALYSLGNLLTYGPYRLRAPMNRGAVACTTIDAPGHIAHAELRSTLQLAPGVLRRDRRRRALKLVDSLSALDFPTTGVVVRRDGVLARRDSVSGPAPTKRR